MPDGNQLRPYLWINICKGMELKRGEVSISESAKTGYYADIYYMILTQFWQCFKEFTLINSN